MAIGYFAPTSYSGRVLYTAPPKPTSAVAIAPTSPVPPRTATIPVPKMPTTTTTTSTAQPFSGGITTTIAGGAGDQFVSGGTTSPQATGSVSGTGSTGGTDTSGQSDTSRLIDLIAGAFQPQSVQQPFGPTAVDSGTMTDATTAPATSGTNPMAVLVLAILAIVGVVWYVHRKGKRAA